MNSTARTKRWLIRIWLAIVLFGIAVFVNVVISVRQGRTVVVAQSTLHNIVGALETYHDDFHAYPPENATNDGSGVFLNYLCKQIKNGEMQFGPYFQLRNNTEFLSPLGGRYTYKLIDGKDGPHPLVIDPGADTRLGGTIDPKRGFVPDNSGADKDNLYSIPPGE